MKYQKIKNHDNKSNQKKQLNFINEANNLLHEDSLTGILEANKQGAFLFWNHPAWPAQRSDGIARLDDYHKYLIYWEITEFLYEKKYGKKYGD